MPDDRVALVKQANDIVDVIGGYLALRPAGATFKGLCPFHDDHNPSFTVDPRRQTFKCWPCGKYGDVIDFVREFERVEFGEALELLARRAGISLEKIGGRAQNPGRARMLEVVRWAAEQYHRCLLDSPLADAARRYVAERGLTGETVRAFTLGYAPLGGDWLAPRAAAAGFPAEALEEVGLLGRRTEGQGHYDRFRDRVMFPIRDASGRVVGFGGRILPSSPLSSRAVKYYNSSETPLFKKSELLYGLDRAKDAGRKEGYLAVVEGYTDVLMAHQAGIPPVVSTMGTALNERHVRQLRRWVPRVVLVFDADAGGATGVDRALATFVSHELDLAVATLPAGMDPCDLIVAQGAEPFRRALAEAVDALEFKLNQTLTAEAAHGIEGQRRAVDAVLGVIAQAPDLPDHAGAVKLELIVTRIAQRLSIREETLWARLRELRAQRSAPRAAEPPPQPKRAPAAPRERQLLEVLLAEPALIATAAAEVRPDEVEHPGLRRLLEVMVALHREGAVPEFDRVRARLDNPELAAYALHMQEVGRRCADRAGWLEGLLAEFRRRRVEPAKQELQNQLQAASDHTEAVELLRRLQQRTDGPRPGQPPAADLGS